MFIKSSSKQFVVLLFTTGHTYSIMRYVGAYISNSEGTRFGNELNFTTQNGVIGIVTDAVASITTTTATFYGSISGDGGAQITERGFCWSKTTNPTITDT